MLAVCGDIGAADGDEPSYIARAHHGSLAREERLVVEDLLKSGELPCLVATSSLELGIDMGAVDLVIQVESPKSVTAGLQRIGRAGHNGEVVLATVLKMAVMPVVAWLVGVALGLDDRVLLGVVITAALPTAQNIFLHATRYRVGEDVSRETILVTTLASLPVALLVAVLLG